MENKLQYLAVFAGTALVAAYPAHADVYSAPKTIGGGKAVLLEPLTFVNITDLDFGGFVVPTSGSGTVTVDAATGTVTNGASLVNMPQYAQARGHFMGAGTPGQGVTVTAVLPSKLYLDGNTSSPTSIDVTLKLDKSAELDGSFAYTIASNKVLDVYVGGDLTISAGMTPGIYSNTYDLTATYQ